MVYIPVATCSPKQHMYTDTLKMQEMLMMRCVRIIMMANSPHGIFLYLQGEAGERGFNGTNGEPGVPGQDVSYVFHVLQQKITLSLPPL